MPVEIYDIPTGTNSNGRQTTLLRSEEAQEIISSGKGFLSRWALLISVAILLILGCALSFIKYPDIIQASAALTAANAPKEIVVRQEGKLVKLLVANDDRIVKGDMIGWIESTADHREVIELSGLLNKATYFLNNDQTRDVPDLFSKTFKNLGELQSSYQQFIISLQQFDDYLVNGYYNRRKAMLLTDHKSLQKLHKYVELQEQLTRQDLQLANEEYIATDSLFKDKVISKQDLRNLESKLIGKQMVVPQLQSSLLVNESQQVEKQKEISEIDHLKSQQRIIFQQSLQTLISIINDWRKKYFIEAPEDGKVVFSIPLQENQFLQPGKIIGFINPKDSRYYAQIMLPQTNFGKIDTGQKVQLRFDAYPYQEFGFVEGRLSYISNIASDSGFLATIQLPYGLHTNYKREIQYRNGLRSKAIIIVKEARLLQRFYYNITQGLQR